ncbi:MAG: ATP-binding cassette domain-containing protein [Candidatus Eisenbacteria bacterium]|uniref:ATP-binding cassette domain-containing protein n=1 Tax=Eiseniibacteriota bacterium TaxID=2212470 RepID=A0A849SJE6_UNCEI|nr:ATP-binding cassette domain-containing protein [Candidatus Eisenbacteria bacterium]
MITFDQVSKRYGERLALDNVSWTMDEGECVVFVGPSGAGKTSILRLVTHEIQPSSGHVTVGTFKGGRLHRTHRALLRRTLGIVYEDFRLLHDRSVFENVALAVRIAGRFSDEEVIPRVMYALDEVGLHHKHPSFPHELSYGERQRVAIARAIVNRPAVILADEPTGALESRSSGEVIALLRRIHEEGAAVILMTTRMDVARQIGGRIIRLEDGKFLDVNGQPLGSIETGRATSTAPTPLFSGPTPTPPLAGEPTGTDPLNSLATPPAPAEGI